MKLDRLLDRIAKKCFIDLLDKLLENYTREQLAKYIREENEFTEKSVISRVSKFFTIYNKKLVLEAIGEEYFNETTKVVPSVHTKVAKIRQKILDDDYPEQFGKDLEKQIIAFKAEFSQSNQSC